MAVERDNMDTINKSLKITEAENPTVLADFWTMVRRLPQYLRLVADMARDPEVPPKAKALLIFGGAYTVSPIDLVPGIIPVAGQLDDLYVVLTSIQQAVRLSPDAVIERHLTAHGLTMAIINDDLASVRALVREGVVRGLRYGGRVVTVLRNQTSSLVQTLRTKGAQLRDEKSL
jgi:uncharacterized membrane protein YkvA (DUF1232 family)